MRILAFDTAGGACSVAVSDDGKPVAVRQNPMTRGHAEALAPMIDAVMAAAGLAFGDLHRLAVTRGPGSFTGLRIGLAAARGLSLATDLPLVAASTTEVLAAATEVDERADRHLLAVLDSKRGDAYAQVFHSDLRPWGEAFILSRNTAGDGLPDGPLLMIGDAASVVAKLLPSTTDVVISRASPTVDPVILAHLAGAREPTYPVRPLYLRPPEATLPADQGQLRP